MTEISTSPTAGAVVAGDEIPLVRMVNGVPTLFEIAAASLQGAAGPSGTVWSFRGPFTAGMAYAVNDIITYGGNTYLVTSAFTAGQSFTTTNEQLIAAGGLAGVAGTAGAQGASFLTSLGVPTASVGNNGDSCEVLGTGEVYQKVNGAWVDTGVTLKGAPGAGAVAAPAVIGGIAVGTAGAAGSIYAGFVLAGGDDFDAPLDIVKARSSQGRYFTTRAYVGPGGSNNGPRGAPILYGYDSDPAHCGYNDSNHGTPLTSTADLMFVANSRLSLGARLARTAAEKASVNNGQVALSSMVHTAGFIVAAAPCIIEFFSRLNPDIVTFGASVNSAYPHPSLWLLPMNPCQTWSGYELDFEATGESYGLNGQTWTAGAAQPFPNNGKDQALGTQDGNLHKLTYNISSTQAEWLVDDALAQTFVFPTPIAAGRPFYGLITNHIVNSGAYGTSELYIETDYIRFWHSASGQHRTPASVQPDINVDFAGNFSTTLATATALWGTGTYTDTLETIPNEANAPGGGYNGSYSTAGAASAVLFPPGITYNASTNVLAGSNFDKPGRAYLARYATAPGDTCLVQRFAINVGPRFEFPSTTTNNVTTVTPLQMTQGTPFSHDLYPELDVGDLLPKRITVSGLPAGITMVLSGNTMGLLSGTPTGSSGGVITITGTNVAGQSVQATRAYTLSVAQGGGAGQLAPTNSSGGAIPNLVGSLDFDNTSLVTVNGSNQITAAAGADGTSYGATQATVASAPVRSLVSGHYAAQFSKANAEYMDWGALVSGAAATFAGDHTIVVVGQITSYTSAMYLLDAAQAAAASTAQRSGLLFGGTFAASGSAETAGTAFRCGATGITDAVKTDANVAATPFCLIGRAYTEYNSVELLVNAAANNSSITPASGVGNTPASIDTVTIGSRKSSGAYGLPLDGYIFRILVYARALTVAEMTSVLEWANTAYGTPTS